MGKTHFFKKEHKKRQITEIAYEINGNIQHTIWKNLIRVSTAQQEKTNAVAGIHYGSVMDEKRTQNRELAKIDPGYMFQPYEYGNQHRNHKQITWEHQLARSRPPSAQRREQSAAQQLYAACVQQQTSGRIGRNNFPHGDNTEKNNWSRLQQKSHKLYQQI